MTNKKDLKPCIHCKKECDYYYIQLGDMYDALHLRLCSDKCVIMITLEFLREVEEYKNFKYYLDKMELKEDKALRHKELEETNMKTCLDYKLLQSAKPLYIHNIPEKLRYKEKT